MDVSTIRRSVVISPASEIGTHCSDCEARHTGMCDALPDEDLKSLSRSAQHMTITAGTLFFGEGDPALYFYNISHGNVRVFKSLPDGRRHITGFMQIGQFLGLDQSSHYAFSAEAMDEVHVCRFNRAKMAILLDEFPALERRLLSIAAHELTIAHEQMLLLARKNAAERVASYLLNLVLHQVVCSQGILPVGPTVLALPVSRADIADYLGLTIETVSRSFTQLKKTMLIDFNNAHAVTLLDPRKLERVASGG